MDTPTLDRHWFQFSLRSLLAAVTLLAILSAWPGPVVVQRINEWRRGNGLDQVRPPLHSVVIELFDPTTGKFSPFDNGVLEIP